MRKKNFFFPSIFLINIYLLHLIRFNSTQKNWVVHFTWINKIYESELVDIFCLFCRRSKHTNLSVSTNLDKWSRLKSVQPYNIKQREMSRLVIFFLLYIYELMKRNEMERRKFATRNKNLLFHFHILNLKYIWRIVSQVLDVVDLLS